MHVKGVAVLLAYLVAIYISPTVEGFNVGVKGTKCNLDPTKGELNDPCLSLYDAVCEGKYCACPAGTHEDPGLKRCVQGDAPKTSIGGSQSGGGGGGGDFFDDVIDNYPGSGKKTPTPPPPAPPPAVPAPPPRQPQPQPPPPYNPNQPVYPNQPGQPNQPGYPNQPGSNQPRNPNQPGAKNDNLPEEVGGGVGGMIGLLIIGGIIYFCCCKGAKRNEMMNKFGGGRFAGIPFIGGGQQATQGGQMQMQQSAPVQQDLQFGSQHTYIPPGTVPPPDKAQYGAPQQPYPPPAGFAPDGQQPPPYNAQYQPNAPPPQ